MVDKTLSSKVAVLNAVYQEGIQSEQHTQHALIKSFHTQNTQQDTSTPKHNHNQSHVSPSGRNEASSFSNDKRVDHTLRKHHICSIGCHPSVSHSAQTRHTKCPHTPSTPPLYTKNGDKHTSHSSTHTHSQQHHRTVSHDSHYVRNVQEWPVDQLGTSHGSQSTTDMTWTPHTPRLVWPPQQRTQQQQQTNPTQSQK